MRKPEELEHDLDAGEAAPVYLLCGPADFLVERFVRRVAAAQGEARVTVEAGEVSPEELRVGALAPDLFSTPRLVFVRGVEAWKPKARTQLLADTGAGGLPPGRRLVLGWTTKKPPRSKVPTGVAAAFFWTPFPSVLPRMVEGWVRDHGGRPGRGVGDRLVELYGDDLRRMDQEAFKLAVSVEGTVGVQDVDRLCARPLESRAFRVAEAITARDLEAALEGLGEVLSTDGPHALLAILANRYRRMLALHLLGAEEASLARRAHQAAEQLARRGGRPLSRAQRGNLEGDVRALLDAAGEGPLQGLQPWQASGLLVHADRHGRADLEAGLRGCARADRLLKGEGGVEAWALERLVCELAARS